MVSSGSHAALIGGWIVFVVCILGFLFFAAWMIYRAIHKRHERKAHWVLPAIDEEVRTRDCCRLYDCHCHKQKRT